MQPMRLNVTYLAVLLAVLLLAKNNQSHNLQPLQMGWKGSSNRSQQQVRSPKPPLRSKIIRRATNLTIAETGGVVLLLHSTTQLLNHKKALDFAVKYLAINALTDITGETFVQRLWYHRLLCGLDHQQFCYTCVPPSLLASSSKAGHKNSKAVHFGADSTIFEIDVSESVEKCLVGTSEFRTPIPSLKRDKIRFFQQCHHLGTLSPIQGVFR